MKLILFIFALAMFNSYTSFAQQQCDYKIDILVEGEVFQKNDFKWQMKSTKIEGAPTNITGTAEIQDSSGKTVKAYKPWASEPISKQKTSNEYSPNLKEGLYKLIATIDVACNDTKKDNNADFKLVKITNQNGAVNKENNNQNTPQQIMIAEAKNTETMNKTGNHSFQNNNPAVMNNTIEMQKNQSAKNALIAQQKEKPDDETEHTIMLHEKNGQKGKNLKPITTAVQESVVYESSNEKSKNLIVIFLLALSILLNIILIWKR